MWLALTRDIRRKGWVLEALLPLPGLLQAYPFVWEEEDEIYCGVGYASGDVCASRTNVLPCA